MTIGPVLVYVGFAASLTHFNDQHGPFSTTSLLLLCLFLASLTVFVAYPAWFIGRRGRTPGMKAAGVRLYRIDRADRADRATGQPLGARPLNRMVSCSGGHGLLAHPLLRSRHRLHVVL